MADTLDRTAAENACKVSHPALFVVFQCDQPLDGGARCPLQDVTRLTLTRGDQLGFDTYEAGRRRHATLRVADKWLSEPHAELRRTPGGWSIEDRSSHNGTFLDGRRVDHSRLLDDGALIEVGHTLLLYRVLEEADAPYQVSGTREEIGLDTLSPKLERMFDDVGRVARTNLSVLIRGPTGSGKELIARYVHQHSARRGEFVGVNCGAIPDTLIESELFGHEKGAFTGATGRSEGMIRAAHGGTLLLDEVGDLSLRAQAALLRVLQEQKVKPVGATRAIDVDIRLVSASHRDFDDMMRVGTFREDLFMRLATYQVALPSLAERREDLGLLTAAILRRIGARKDLRIRVEAARALMTYGWARNIRELEACLRRAVALVDDGRVDVHHLGLRPPVAQQPSTVELSEEDAALRRTVIAALREHRGNVTRAAQAMGKQRRTVQRWIKRLAIDARSWTPRPSSTED